MSDLIACIFGAAVKAGLMAVTAIVEFVRLLADTARFGLEAWRESRSTADD